MHEFYELEKKCKKLALKRYLKILSVFIILIIITIGSYLLYDYFNQPQKLTQKNIVHNQIKPIIKKEKPKEIKKPIQKKEKPKKPKKIEQKPPIVEPKLDVEIDFNNIKNLKTTKQNNKPKEIKKPIQKKESKEEQKPKKIVQNETITFNKALVLAKNYYENGDYENSIKWCKFASRLNNKDERIWKLYALNLEKIGQKQKAIKVLKTYLKYKNSLELKYLLQRLQE